MDNNRKTAFFILSDVENRRAYSHIAAGNQIERMRPDKPAFVRELAYGVIRRKLYLDYVIANFVKTPVEKLPSADRILLHMGLYQLIHMNSVPDYAAVDETVELAGRYARGREGFINGVLRQFIRDKEYVDPEKDVKDEIERISIRYSYAPWIVRMWIDEWGKKRAVSLLEAGNTVAPLTIRVNRLKTNRDDLYRRLATRDFKVRNNEHIRDMLYVDGEEVIGGRFYKSGLYSVQDEASLVAVLMLDPKPGETIIDTCAAPGGKTMAIAEAMGNMGKVIAMDVYKRKLYYISEQAERLGISIVKTRSRDATRVDPGLEDSADRVLVDAPCSGLGTIRKKPEIKYKTWDHEMEELPAKQKDILSASARYVKPGGVLVYYTCTIAKRENQQVVTEFLKRRSDFEKVEVKQLLPDTDGTDGFFICKMKRREGLV